MESNMTQNVNNISNSNVQGGVASATTVSNSFNQSYQINTGNKDIDNALSSLVKAIDSLANNAPSKERDIKDMYEDAHAIIDEQSIP
jgi:predicted HAD superfamily Cof-like phosphohydrolase